MAPCPHCGGTTTIEKNASLRWICGVCGGPIVPADIEAPRSNTELASLVRAKRTRAIAFGWTAATIAFVLMSLMTLGLGGLLVSVALLPSVLLGATGLVLFVMAMFMRGRAKANDATSTRELDAAWESVADEVLRARGRDITAKDLAAAMHTTEAHAETLLTALSVHDRARIQVDDNAELHYSAEQPRVRVAADDDAHEERTEAAVDPARPHAGTERR